MSENLREPIFIIDGYGMIYRSYFAFARTPIRNAQGQNSSAIFGFFRVLASFIKQYKPSYLAIAMDSMTPTFRDEIYPEYKATRESTPEDLRAQFPIIENVIAALGLPSLRVDRFEADDIMATVAKICESEGRECVVISADKDLLQLVRPGVRVFKPSRDGGFEEMDREAVKADKGVWPEQILDYLSLLGDASDNVPGVKGIGEKSASKLLEEFKTLDGIYEGIDAVASASQREKLLAGKKDAYFSKTLITLREDVPLPPHREWENFHLHGFNGPAAAAILKDQGINQLAAEIARLGNPKTSDATGLVKPTVEQNDATAATVAEAPSSKSDPVKTHETSVHHYEIVRDLEGVRRWADRIRQAGVYVLDTETDGLDPHSSKLVGISISVAADEACYIPLWGPSNPQGQGEPIPLLPEDDVRAILKPVVENPAYRLVGQNIKFDYQMLQAWGVTMANPWFDTMIAAWLCDTTANFYNMDDLALSYLNYRTIHFADLFQGMAPLESAGSELDFGPGLSDAGGADPDTVSEDEESPRKSEKAPKVGKLKPKDLKFSRIDVDKGGIYSAEDSDITFRLYLALAPKLKEMGLEKLFFELEMPLIPILAAMEWKGMVLRTEILRDYSVELEGRLAKIEQEIYEMVKHPFNIASTKQLQEVLFKELGLAGSKKTKTGYSTDTSVLEELALEHPVPQKILDYRMLSKLKSTYVDSLPLMVNPKTGRIHTNLVQTGTATGRIASKDPNMQNIPIRDEDGRRIREAFVPAKGFVYVSADYSQIELVVLAHFAKDPGLLAAFRDGVDVHRATGSLIFGVKPEDVSPEQRRISKTINFGVMYGMSAFRLARELSIPQKQAQAFIDSYFATYSGIRRFIDETVAQAQKDGGVRTMLGRFRPIPAINSRNKTEQQAAARVAVNTPIQGSAADIVKRAMIRLSKRLADEKLEAKLVLQVHDELILEVPEAERDIIMKIVPEEMSRAVELDVPLRTSVEYGDSWGVMH